MCEMMLSNLLLSKLCQNEHEFTHNRLHIYSHTHTQAHTPLLSPFVVQTRVGLGQGHSEASN